MNADAIELESIKENAKQAATLLKSLSNESRLMVLCHLGENELSVTELNKLITLSQSSLSQHLARLRQDGLVVTRRESQTIYYRIANPVALKIISVLQNEYCS